MTMHNVQGFTHNDKSSQRFITQLCNFPKLYRYFFSQHAAVFSKKKSLINPPNPSYPATNKKQSQRLAGEHSGTFTSEVCRAQTRAKRRLNIALRFIRWPETKLLGQSEKNMFSCKRLDIF